MELRFCSSEYYGESFSFDGSRVEVGFIQPRQRPRLGEFLNTYGGLLREGLLSGVLSTAWPPLRPYGRAATVKYDGLKKLDERKPHTLSYKAGQGPRRGAGAARLRSRHVPARAQLLQALAAVLDGRRHPAHCEPAARALRDRGETLDGFETPEGLSLPERRRLVFNMDGPSTIALGRWDSVLEKVSARSLSPP